MHLDLMESLSFTPFIQQSFAECLFSQEREGAGHAAADKCHKASASMGVILVEGLWQELNKNSDNREECYKKKK